MACAMAIVTLWTSRPLRRIVLQWIGFAVWRFTSPDSQRSAHPDGGAQLSVHDPRDRSTWRPGRTLWSAAPIAAHGNFSIPRLTLERFAMPCGVRCNRRRQAHGRGRCGPHTEPLLPWRPRASRALPGVRRGRAPDRRITGLPGVPGELPAVSSPLDLGRHRRARPPCADLLGRRRGAWCKQTTHERKRHGASKSTTLAS